MAIGYDQDKKSVGAINAQYTRAFIPCFMWMPSRILFASIFANTKLITVYRTIIMPR